MDTNTNFNNSSINIDAGIPPTIAYYREIIIQTTNPAVMRYVSTIACYRCIGSIMKQESLFDSLSDGGKLCK
jgi:hypothetical protein